MILQYFFITVAGILQGFLHPCTTALECNVKPSSNLKQGFIAVERYHDYFLSNTKFEKNKVAR